MILLASYNLLDPPNFKISLLTVKHGLIRLTSELAELQNEEQKYFVFCRFYLHLKIWRQMLHCKVGLLECFHILIFDVI